MSDYDFAIVGAGIAGAAFAARVAPHARVLLLEQEPQPGYHSTGRSAALYTSLYGNDLVRALSRASHDFLHAPPTGFSEHPLLTPRGRMYVGTDAQRDAIESIAMLPLTRRLSGAQARARVPVLRPEAAVHAVLDTSAHDIDVHALHQGYLRQARHAGAMLVGNAGVIALEYRDHWQVTTGQGTFHARTLVNAAGAWCDRIAELAGVAPLGIQPLRRTAVLIDSPDAHGSASWPAVIAADASYYFKPDAGLILTSPCDETPTPPCDAQPEELDIAIGIDRIEAVTTMRIRRVTRAWAGLRSFAPDRSPVVGYDGQAPGFFWLAGLGGYGVQTAPALSQLAANLALRTPPHADLAAEPTLCASAFAPQRLRDIPVVSTIASAG
jgi:D-arginine dehydrogenase